jgi:hypothetical protein
MSCVKAVIRLNKKAKSEIETQIEESEMRIRGISDYTILAAAASSSSSTAFGNERVAKRR